MSGNKVPVPIIWIPVGDIASTITSSCKPIVKLLRKEDAVARGFTSEKLEKMIFKFRNSKECRTDRPFEVDGKGKFTIYEPFWSQVHAKFETIKGKVVTTVFDDCTDWQGSKYGMPWPGEGSSGKTIYAKLSGGPINMTDTGLNKTRKEIQNQTQVSDSSEIIGSYVIQKPD